MTRPELAHPPIVEADEVGLTSAEAVRLARASLDRLERAAALRDHLEMLFAVASTELVEIWKSRAVGGAPHMAEPAALLGDHRAPG